jgi:hypothetical protein
MSSMTNGTPRQTSTAITDASAVAGSPSHATGASTKPAARNK